ncbi:MAG: zinc-binding alcohol dehydrogenase family protein [Verrucomicrobiales bacterium]|nr:zinc-binding alcohol dehydrogenase family protein [Verrucomicrobiales bacterium]
MRAVTIAEPKRLERIDIAAPGCPAPGEALVRTHRMGVCGTDISSFLGKFPFFDYPRIPGHELGVEVLEVGKSVKNVKTGDRCSVEPYMNCGVCYPCRKGKQNCCEKLNVIGIMSDGGLCDRFLIRAEKLHPSDSLSYDQLALVETLAIGCHGTARVAPESGDQVLIIGAGPIGLSMLEFTLLTGAQVTVMDMSESRLSFCERNYGITNTVIYKGNGSEIEQINKITDGDRFAVVADATGSHQSMANALQYVAHSGKLLFLGVTTSEITFPHPAMHKPEMTIMSARNALPSDFRNIITLIETGKIDSNPWITHRTGFENSIAEFATFCDPASGVIKAMIEVN